MTEFSATSPSEGTAPNPRKGYASPQMLVAASDLTDAQKRALLKEWQLEVDNRLVAEQEGMSASDPMRAEREARLADEAARVSKALRSLADQEGGAA